MKYKDFLLSKTHSANDGGFKPLWLPDFLMDFQISLTEFNLLRGRSATFADCGLGKTPMQLVWAENVVRKTNKPVLLFAPLGVSAQTVREGEKFGIEVHRSKNGKLKKGINVTNYERRHLFDPSDLAGVGADESSIIKHFGGSTQQEITQFSRKIQYRSLWTATAAPNDFVELGTSSEVLGQLGNMDMLNRFFKNDLNNSAVGRAYGEAVKWRFKGHAEIPFWRWVCSWARAIRKPSDLGFDDKKFQLPPLIEDYHIVDCEDPGEGFLFKLPAIGLKEQRDERRSTLKERCERVAELVKTGKPALVWCHLNDEGDLLEKMIPDCLQVSGRDSDDAKEEKWLAFSKGQSRVMVSKQKIFGWGLNAQFCSHVVSFVSHSFEAYYQGIRRCWRFGQKYPVKSDIVLSEGEKPIMSNLKRKQAQAEEMFSRLTSEMNSSIKIDVGTKFTDKERIPQWL